MSKEKKQIEDTEELRRVIRELQAKVDKMEEDVSSEYSNRDRQYFFTIEANKSGSGFFLFPKNTKRIY